MLTDRSILYIANDWVRDNKTSAHHIAEVLARSNRVLYVEGAGMRAPRASGRDLRKIFRKLSRIWDRPVRIAENMHLFSPTLLPFHRFRLVRWLNGLILGYSLNRAVRDAGLDEPILWVFMPHFAPALDRVRKRGVVYYCVDEYSSQPLVDPHNIREMERSILERADIVFAVSDELVDDKKRVNSNTFLSPHGVDLALFRAAAEDGPIPSDIASIKRPIAGYYGLIEEWVDLDRLAYLAERLPDVSFVMIGRVVQDTTRFARMRNVHFLGPRPYESLPGYLRAFDVGLLLYREGEFARNANPKKLREYLAGGKAVVSVPLKEVSKYGSVVRIAQSNEEYADAVREAIADSSTEATHARQQAVVAESWEARVSALGDLVSTHVLNDRQGEH